MVFGAITLSAYLSIGSMLYGATLAKSAAPTENALMGNVGAVIYALPPQLGKAIVFNFLKSPTDDSLVLPQVSVERFDAITRLDYEAHDLMYADYRSAISQIVANSMDPFHSTPEDRLIAANKWRELADKVGPLLNDPQKRKVLEEAALWTRQRVPPDLQLKIGQRMKAMAAALDATAAPARLAHGSVLVRPAQQNSFARRHSRLAPPEGWRQVLFVPRDYDLLQSLDEDGTINLEVETGLDYRTGRRWAQVSAWQISRDQSRGKNDIPENIRRGIQVVLSGESQGLKFLLTRLPQARREFDETDKAEIEINFYGQRIGKYRIENETLVPMMSPRMLSRFDIRAISEEGKIYARNPDGSINKGSYQLFLGPDGNPHLRNWIRHPVFVASGPNPFSSKVDLHTHLTGAVRTKDLLEIAEKLNIPYPVKLLKERYLDYRHDAVFERDGEKFVPFSKENITFSMVHDPGPDPWWTNLYDDLDINPSDSVEFEQLSRIYRARAPLTQDIRAFPLILEAIAKDYARHGVEYAELSFYAVVQPAWLKVADTVVPQLEKKYGVKIKFLVGMWRHSDQKINTQVVNELQEAMRISPHIVGVDFMGQETNATMDFSKALADLSKLKKAFPYMVIRVHAGENPDHLDNVLDAIKLGATRIGHGIYGVSDEVLALAKKNDVIVELNFNSNLALRNIGGLETLKDTLHRYLKAGVRVTLGTDGHGIYHTTPQSEEAVARALGLTDQDLLAIKKSDARYMKELERKISAARKRRIA